jgi:hypothetical protein
MQILELLDNFHAELSALATQNYIFDVTLHSHSRIQLLFFIIFYFIGPI